MQPSSGDGLDKYELGGEREGQGHRDTGTHEGRAALDTVGGGPDFLKMQVVAASRLQSPQGKPVARLVSGRTAEGDEHATPERGGVVLDSVPMHTVGAVGDVIEIRLAYQWAQLRAIESELHPGV